MYKPIYEFLLWNTCKNNCKFCHQKANKLKYPGKFPSDSEKLFPIKLARNFLETHDLEQGSHILLMGGELFDSVLPAETENEFLSLASYIAEGMRQNRYGFMYFNTNLLYEDLTLLKKYLDTFKGLEDRIKFTTSYDIEYRFKSKEDRALVQKNMMYISAHYPNCVRIANCIMTDKAINYFKEHNFIQYHSDFLYDFGFDIHLIPYITLVPEQASSRQDVLKLLVDVEHYQPGFLKQYVIDASYLQTRNLYEFNGTELKYATSKISDCGHYENFRRVYKDSTRCFACDCEQLLSMNV